MTLVRRAVRLTVDHVADLPDPCRTCLFWELDPVRRDRVCAADRSEEKQTWVSTVLREWGSCGQVVLADDKPVGYVLYAPPAFVAGASVLPTAPVTPDAVQLSTVHVDAAYAGGGLGRLLVRAAAKDLVERDVVALEAFGDSRTGAGKREVHRPEHACVVPTGFLSAVGFRTQRAHPVHPRMRMELRSTLTWKDEVEAAIGALLGTLRPQHAPKAARPHARDGRPPV